MSDLILEIDVDGNFHSIGNIKIKSSEFLIRAFNDSSHNIFLNIYDKNFSKPRYIKSRAIEYIVDVLLNCECLQNIKFLDVNWLQNLINQTKQGYHKNKYIEIIRNYKINQLI